MGILIRKYRMVRDMSQAEVATAMNVSQMTLSRWERGTRGMTAAEFFFFGHQVLNLTDREWGEIILEAQYSPDELEERQATRRENHSSFVSR